MRDLVLLYYSLGRSGVDLFTFLAFLSFLALLDSSIRGTNAENRIVYDYVHGGNIFEKVRSETCWKVIANCFHKQFLSRLNQLMTD